MCASNSHRTVKRQRKREKVVIPEYLLRMLQANGITYEELQYSSCWLQQVSQSMSQHKTKKNSKIAGRLMSLDVGWCGLVSFFFWLSVVSVSPLRLRWVSDHPLMKSCAWASGRTQSYMTYETDTGNYGDIILIFHKISIIWCNVVEYNSITVT